jgi:hypothetical protein
MKFGGESKFHSHINRKEDHQCQRMGNEPAAFSLWCQQITARPSTNGHETIELSKLFQLFINFN